MAVGLALIDFANKSSESALSVYPIAIGNCKENRSVTTDACFNHKQFLDTFLDKTAIGFEMFWFKN